MRVWDEELQWRRFNLTHRRTRTEREPASLLTDMSPDRSRIKASTSSPTEDDLSLAAEAWRVGSGGRVGFVTSGDLSSGFSDVTGGRSVVSEEHSDPDGSSVLTGEGSQLSGPLGSSSEVGVIFPSSMPESELEVLPDASLSGLSWSSSLASSSCSFTRVWLGAGVSARPSKLISEGSLHGAWKHAEMF